ncbi:MAG: EamA family transporter [Gemmatimonadetes bacterium]|nr:EamA family transporter [Gemmatimonadota bacterium]
MTARTAPTRAQVLMAFIAVYVLWGSSYISIRVAIESIPPFLMSGARNVIAGILLSAFALLRGAERPRGIEVRATAVTGLLMLCLGNGTVTWGEKFTASGRVALIVSMTPVWFVLIEWLRPGGTRPSRMLMTGLAIGATGVALLVGADAISGTHGAAATTAELVVLGGSLSWAIGSMYSRHAPLPASSGLASALQMMFAGSYLVAFGLASGEAATFHLAQVTTRSAIAFTYLVAGPSLIGYSAFVWLLKVSTPAKVGTYGYVNPVIAVFLGWLVIGEAVTPRMIAATCVIVAGVALITFARAPQPASREPEPEGEHA